MTFRSAQQGQDPRMNPTRPIPGFAGKTVASIEVDDAHGGSPRYGVVTFTDGTFFSVSLERVPTETYYTSGSGTSENRLAINHSYQGDGR